MDRGAKLRLAMALATCVAAGIVWMKQTKAQGIAERARKLHFASLVIDTHDDTTQRFVDGDFDMPSAIRAEASIYRE
jgi:hypothetical protein